VPLTTDEELRGLLATTTSVAVVGIKAEPSEDAFRVPAWLQGQGLRILPVSPKLDRVLGEEAVPGIAGLKETPDLVDLFRASRHIPGHVDEILALERRPRGVWMQLGIHHPEATARLEAEGIAVVEDRCLLVEWRRLMSPAVAS
jgi:predicted CoA-binding protein